MKDYKKANVKDTFIKILPLALILLIVPMIVFMKESNIKSVPSDFVAPDTRYDFFNYYKAMWLIVLSISSIIFISFYAYVKKFRFKPSNSFIPLFVYYIFVFLSSSFSENHAVSFNGFPNRNEGLWVISCYIVVCFITAHFITYEKDIKILFGALIICTTFLCILGISQFFGFDLLQLDFVKKLMLPSEYESLSKSLSFKFPTRFIYLTLFNPNYVGSFCALVFPICIVATLYAKKASVKIFSGILSVLLLINLIGSRSSAGYIGIFISSILLIISMRKKLLKYWLPILGFVIFCIGILVYLNYNYSGLIVSEIRGFLPQKQEPIIYKESANKSITNMTIDKNVMTIYVGETPINIKYNLNDTALSFSDDIGNEVKAVQNTDERGLLLTFNEPKYLGLRIRLSGSLITVSSPGVKYNVILDANGSFKFLNIAGKPVDIIIAKSFGFEGYEKWASGRGYIWSRSIPLLKDTLLLGHGPDTYTFYFPQNDFAGKLLSFNNPYMLVDKPHNMYIQMAINTGVVSLIAFLVFVLWYVCGSLKLYFKPKNYDSFYYMAGLGCVISVIGFLVTGIANDSNINVSPIFWILLGIGFACNRLYSGELANSTSNPKSNVTSNSSYSRKSK